MDPLRKKKKKTNPGATTDLRGSFHENKNK